MFTKLLAGIEQIMPFITLYWNCDGSLKGRCYGNRFVCPVGENWCTTSAFCALAFHNEWKYRIVNFALIPPSIPVRLLKISWTLVQ